MLLLGNIKFLESLIQANPFAITYIARHRNPVHLLTLVPLYVPVTTSNYISVQLVFVLTELCEYECVTVCMHALFTGT